MDYWPLFQLKITSPRLELRLPTDDDIPGVIEAVKTGIHDPAWMPFSNPWTDAQSPELERNTAQWVWKGRAEWAPDNWRLGLVVFLEGKLVGAQDVGAKNFAKLRTVSSGSWLTQNRQGQGLGKEMRAAMLHFAFAGLGADVAESEAWEQNAASIAVSTSLGYERNGVGRRVAPRGKGLVNSVRFRLTREGWEATQRPDVTIEGLQSCLEMFGAGAPGAKEKGPEGPLS